MSTAVIHPPYAGTGMGGGAFEREVRVHLDRVYAGALWMTSDPAAAGELVQRTFERAVRDFHWALPEAAVPGWLYRHLVRAWFEAEPPVRPTRRAQSGTSGSASGGASGPRGSADKAAPGARDGIAPIIRITLYLADVEELPVAEIAGITEVPAGIVEARIRRGHAQLAGQLATWLRQTADGSRTA